MQVELGTQVRMADGQVVGPVERLILEPGTYQIRAVVIGAGGRLPQAVEVQLASLTSGPAGDLRLEMPAEEIEALPAFVERDYQGEPLTGATPTVGSAAGEALWPTGYAPPPPAGRGTPTAADTTDLREAAVTTDRDQQSAVIGAGSVVQAGDGQTVGEVGGLTFDEATGQVTTLAVRRGGAAGALAVPASLIASVDDNLIRLTVPANEIPEHTV